MTKKEIKEKMLNIAMDSYKCGCIDTCKTLKESFENMLKTENTMTLKFTLRDIIDLIDIAQKHILSLEKKEDKEVKEND